MAKTKSQTYLQQGDPAPGFQLPGIDGKTHSLQDFADKEGLLAIFICNHCPYVKARIGDIVRLHEEFGDRIAFVGINSNDPEYPGEGLGNMKAFAQERGIRFPYLIDENGDTAKAYGATCTPDPFLFNHDQKLVFHGRITDALEPDDQTTEHTMSGTIRKLLDGEKISPWFNPSLGCSIKFKGQH